VLSSLPRARDAFAALLLIAVVATGCGDSAQGDGPASRFERELESMPGVADARVEREAFDTDYWGEEIVVDMDGDASADEATAILDAFHARQQETNGDPQDARVTIGAGTTRSDGDQLSPNAPPQVVPAEGAAGNARLARLLVTAVAAFPGDFVSVTSTNWSVIGAAEGDDPRAELERMIGVVRADELLSTTKGLALTAVAGPDNDRRTVSLDAYDGLTPELVSSWRRLAARLDPRLVQGVSFGSASIYLNVRAGENVKPRQLTTDAYGDVLWPTLHAALDTIVAMPRSATLSVTNRYDVNADEGGSYLEDRFLNIRPQLRTGRDRLGRTWNAAAGAYLDQVLVTPPAA
jgi:hypothetical protein